MVLRGAGQAFSTGGDLAEFGMAPSPIVARWVRFRRDVWGMLRGMPIPNKALAHEAECDETARLLLSQMRGS